MTPREELARLAREATPLWRAQGGQQHPVTFGDWMRWLGPCSPEVAAYIEAAINELPSLLARLEAAERERDLNESRFATAHEAGVARAKERDAALADVARLARLAEVAQAITARAVQGGHEDTTDGCDVVPSYLIDQLRAALSPSPRAGNPTTEET